MRKIDGVENLDNKNLTEWSGWMFTDATAAMNCPRCKAKFGEHCRMPSGRKTMTPHSERVEALAATGYDANRGLR